MIDFTSPRALAAENQRLRAELKQARAQVENANECLRDIVQSWDWCQVDPVDRGYSLHSDNIEEARRLSIPSTVLPTTEADK